MPRRLAVAVTLLLAAAGYAAGGVNRWSTGGPEGGVINQIVPDPSRPATVYAATNGGGVFRSDDSGSTWRAAGTGLGFVQGLAISQSSPNVLYAAGDHFVYRTTDGAGHWSFVGAFVDGMVYYAVTGLAVDAGDPNLVWVAATDQHVFGSGALWRSQDGGIHWSGVGFAQFAPSGLVATDPRHPSTAYAQLIGLSRTTDGGATWTAVGTGLGINSLAFPLGSPGVVFGGTSSSGVFVSPDRGDHWVPASAGLSGDALKILDLAAVPGSPGSVYAATQGGLYRTDDSGTSWHFVSAGARPLLRAASDAATTLYARNDLGATRSLDGGVTWSTANHGLVATSVGSLAASESTVLAALDAAVYRSTASGESWSVAFIVPFPASAVVVAADPTNPSTFYLGSCNSPTPLSRSLDSGQSWAAFEEGLAGDCVVGFGAQPVSGGYLFAGAFQHLFRRGLTDSSWNEVAAITARSFFSDPARPDVVWAGADQGLYRSNDAGATWSPVGFDKLVSAIVSDPTDPDTLYLSTYYCCDQNVYKSVDGGATWTLSNDGLPIDGVASLAIDPSPPHAIYAATQLSGVYRSMNGGLGWSPFNNGLRLQLVPASGATSLAFTTPQHRLLAATNFSGVVAWDLTEDRRLGAAASLRGAGGTFFHSDVSVLNASDHEATIQPFFRCFSPPCGTQTGTFTLAPRRAASFVDIVGSLFDALQSGGAVEFQTEDPIVVTSRLYTPSTPAPTLGMFVPGLDPGQASPSEVLLLLSHSADPAAGFRTNVGVFNPNDEDLDVTFTLFRPDGSRMGSFVRQVGALAALQINDADVFEALGLAGDVDSFYAVVAGDGVSQLQAYAAVIDNLSQDPFFVTGRPVVGDQSVNNRATIPAVASLHGHAGTFFHSDVAIWNPNREFPLNIALEYRCLETACASASQTITLQPGEMRVYPDIVGGFLASPETGGALELAGGRRPLVAASRLYSPAHPAPTVGMFVPGLGPEDATPVALLTPLASSADLSTGFRTNVGVFNASNVAQTVSVTLFNTGGLSLGHVALNLGPREVQQINDVFRSAGIFGDVPSAYASVRGDGAHPIYAYAAVIDNQSQDPIFIPGQNDPNPPPLP